MSKKKMSRFLDKFRSKMIKIDLGGGQDPQPGFLNIDKLALPTVDVVHDLEVTPWPLPDGCAELVMGSHIVEHINPAHGGFLRFMDEVWRVLKPDGQFMISFPYAGSPGFWADPTHCNGCTERTWAYFDPLEAGGGLYKIYKPKPWRVAFSSWDVNGNMEVVLVKRREDKSYLV